MKFKRVILFPYSFGSDGAKRVAAELTVREVPNLRVRADGDYHPKDGDFIVGWGAGHPGSWFRECSKVACEYINKPDAICRSVDKITAFTRFKREGVQTPPWTQSEAKALEWSKSGEWVCVRTRTEGMDGAGLILATKPSQLQWAPLYTQFIPNEREFRVYVFDGKVIDTLEKKADDEATNQFIRTESNHYIYLRQGSNIPGLGKLAIAATKALDLTFAGIDIIMDKKGECYVLETNTAPGIGQITARRIAEAIRGMAGL